MTATQEAEAGGTLEHNSLRPAQGIQQDLESKKKRKRKRKKTTKEPEQTLAGLQWDGSQQSGSDTVGLEKATGHIPTHGRGSPGLTGVSPGPGGLRKGALRESSGSWAEGGNQIHGEEFRDTSMQISVLLSRQLLRKSIKEPRSSTVIG
jgi:hypothetical protein